MPEYKGKTLAVMSEQTAARLGNALPLLLEHSKIKATIVLSAEDCFPTPEAQEAFYNMPADENVIRAGIMTAAAHFNAKLAEIHPSLPRLAQGYDDVLFRQILRDAPAAVPMLPADGEKVAFGFVVLGRNHEDGGHLAKKLSGIRDLAGNPNMPTHAEMEQLVVLHEMDHLRPDQFEPMNDTQKLAEETGRDATALALSEGVVSDQVRQLYRDCRMLGVLHTHDAHHRTSLGLTLLDDPHTTDIAVWRNLEALGKELSDTVRNQKSGTADLLRSLFGDKAEALNQAFSHYLSMEDAAERVQSHIETNGHALSPDMLTMLREYLDSNARIAALRVTAPAAGADAAASAAPVAKQA